MRRLNCKNIVLGGFMGCGKTSCGRALARLTNRKYVDIDRYITFREGMSVNDIFATKGEKYFRQREHEAVRHFSRKSRYVIALGGGTLVNPDNVRMLKKNGTIVIINTPIDVIKERLFRTNYRPLLLNKTLEQKNETVDRLYAQRMPVFFKAADYVVESDETPYWVAHKILKTIGII